MESISGKVYVGAGMARTRGMPTANIFSNLKPGVYTGVCDHGGCLLFVHKPPETEIHIIGFEDNLYGEELEVRNIIRISPIITELCYIVNKEN